MLHVGEWARVQLLATTVHFLVSRWTNIILISTSSSSSSSISSVVSAFIVIIEDEDEVEARRITRNDTEMEDNIK